MGNYLKRFIYVSVQLVLVVMLYLLGMYMLDVPATENTWEMIKHGVGLTLIICGALLYKFLDDFYDRLRMNDLL